MESTDSNAVAEPVTTYHKFTKVAEGETPEEYYIIKKVVNTDKTESFLKRKVNAFTDFTDGNLEDQEVGSDIFDKCKDANGVDVVFGGRRRRSSKKSSKKRKTKKSKKTKKSRKARKH